MAHSSVFDSTAVWLDCDPGHDDAFAILLLAHSPSVNLIGISSTHGNQDVAMTTHNVLRMLHAVGKDCKVVQGSSKPLLQPARYCPEIHGGAFAFCASRHGSSTAHDLTHAASGLDAFGSVTFPDVPAAAVAATRARSFVEVMNDAITGHHEETGERVTLLATGCLTNVALLLSVHPGIASSISQIVIMGGACGRGNTGAVAEFNIQVDPDAAAIVFAAGLPLTMVPLEVTHTALVTRGILHRIAAEPLVQGSSDAAPMGSTTFRRLLVGLLRFFAATYRDVFDMPDPPLHDPCAVFYVLRPHAFRCVKARVDIEARNPASLGQTIVDVHNIGKHAESAKNVNVALAMDVDAFWEVMIAAVDAADAVSPLNV